MEYYSNQLQVWEPLLEEWRVEIRLSKSLYPRECTKVRHARTLHGFNRAKAFPEQLFVDFLDYEPHSAQWLVLADYPMQVNITKAMVQTLLNSMESLRLSAKINQKKAKKKKQNRTGELGGDELRSSTEATSSDDAKAALPLPMSPLAEEGGYVSPPEGPVAPSDLDELATKRVQQKLYPYFIHNNTGVNVWYWISGPKEHSLCMLKSDEDQPIVPDYLKSHRKLRMSQDIVPVICFQVEGEFTPVRNLPMDKVGTYVINISPLEYAVWLSYEVSFRMGSKVCWSSS